MEKKYQIIYIWSFIIISGIVLLLLYTPLGGDIHYAAYSEQDRYVVSPGVNYSNQIGSLSNGSSGNSSGYGYYSSPSQYSSESFKGVSSSVNSTSGKSFNSNSGFNSTGLSLKNGKNKTGSGGGEGSAIGVSGVSRRSSVNENTFANNLGGTMLTTTNSSTGTVMQRGTQNEEDPLDPGGDPGGNPLPLDNELIVLMVIAMVYLLSKTNLKK